MIDLANFWSAKFIGETRFSYATFSGGASFNSSKFSGLAIISESTFSGEADFSYATFNERITFVDTTFSEEANFNKADFKHELNFDYSIFTAPKTTAQSPPHSHSSIKLSSEDAEKIVIDDNKGSYLNIKDFQPLIESYLADKTKTIPIRFDYCTFRKRVQFIGKSEKGKEPL